MYTGNTLILYSTRSISSNRRDLTSNINLHGRTSSYDLPDLRFHYINTPLDSHLRIPLRPDLAHMLTPSHPQEFHYANNTSVGVG
jgi:hypothetical protein